MKTTLQSWDEVGVELGKLGQLEAAMKKVTGEIDEQISLIKTEKQDILDEFQKGIDESRDIIQEYAEEHITELRTDESKQKTFATGVIKTREQTKYKYPSPEELVAKLMKLNMEHLINNDPKPDKEAIKKESEDNPGILRKLGIKLIETIFIDIEPHF